MEISNIYFWNNLLWKNKVIISRYSVYTQVQRINTRKLSSTIYLKQMYRFCAIMLRRGYALMKTLSHRFNDLQIRTIRIEFYFITWTIRAAHVRQVIGATTKVGDRWTLTVCMTSSIVSSNREIYFHSNEGVGRKCSLKRIREKWIFQLFVRCFSNKRYLTLKIKKFLRIKLVRSLNWK